MADPRSFGTDPTAPAPLEAEGTAPTTAAHPRIGGRYEILGLLGVGGMGTVYRARDTELDELVALKVLRKELAASPGMLARFRQEVKLARRVTHTNVARTFDIGEEGGDKFLTMELVEGESLGASLARGRPPLRTAVDVAVAICAGLAAAHAAGVIHRDLKPENVIVAKNGRVAITDFGIARALEGADAGRTLGVVGTPEYMAPEQVEGKRDLDARCDVYAVGAILFELLTGRRAWVGESVVSIAAARLIRPPPDPRDVAKDVPDLLAAVVMKCMAKNREDRYASADEIGAELTRLGAAVGRSVAPAAPGAPGATADPAREDGAKTVAVLPMQNFGSADDEYLADALSEDLIDLLSVVGGLRVRPRGASARFSGRDRDPREVGRALGVQVVVDGSVRRLGDAIRVQVRVITVDDGYQLWAKRFDRSPADFLAVGDDVASAIAEALTVEARAERRAPPTDPVALDLYLRGRHEYHRAWFSANVRAVTLLEQAYQRAPKDPRIVAAYALALVRQFATGEIVASDELARTRIEEALQLDPNLAEARVGLATLHIYRGEAITGAQHLRAALALSPQAPDALDWKGRLLVEVGRPREGIALLERAHELEPQLGHTVPMVARTRALLGEWEASDELLRVPPDNPFDATMAWVMRARLVMWRCDPALARAFREDFDANARSLPDTDRMRILTMVEAAETRAVSEDLLAIVASALPESRVVARRAMFFAQLRTEVMCAARALDHAKRFLHDADAHGLTDIEWLDHCPILEELRQDPETAPIHARVSARAERILEALEGH